MNRSPRDLVGSLERQGPSPDDVRERYVGYGVLGLPFTLGHVLGFRRHTVSSIGPAYTSVWHRDPSGRWTIFTTVDPDRSCPRYFSAAAARVVRTDIELEWTGPGRVAVSIPSQHLEWAVKLEATAATRLLGAAGRLLPRSVRRLPAVLERSGPLAGRLLHAGPLTLHGSTPNGQWFELLPHHLRLVTAAAGVVRGRDVGPLGPLPRPARLGDLRVPDRGLFVAGEVVYWPGRRGARSEPRAVVGQS